MRYCCRAGSALIKLFCICLVLLTGSSLLAQVPARPVPPRLVNDMASILSPEQNNALERKLVDFADSTSNQITVVIVPELYGMDKASLAYEIGEKWGVGHEKYNNGIVILVKPKTETERGEAFIATGYGLEGVLPDALASSVVNNEMIPYFKQNDYYGGINNTVDRLMPLLAGEISSDEFANRYGDSESDDLIAAAIGIIFVGFILFCIVVAVFGKNENNMGGNDKGGGRKGPSALDLLLLGSILNNSGGRSSGSGFRGGSGVGFGSSGGGFGGFGGGHFGGGGAGGSW